MLKNNIPRLIFWELTKRCNLNCLHCRAEADDIDYTGELDFDSVCRVIDDIASEYSPILILTGGEPLFRKDIYDIAAYASGKGLRVALASNGTLIDEEVAKKIKNSGISRVAISIDGKSPEFHESFRGVQGAFDGAINGARSLLKAGVEFQFNTSVTKKNVDLNEKLGDPHIEYQEQIALLKKYIYKGMRIIDLIELFHKLRESNDDIKSPFLMHDQKTKTVLLSDTYPLRVL